MNQIIKRSQAVVWGIAIVAFLLFMAVWPGNLIKNTFISKSDEVVAEMSGPVNVEHNITQMFVPQDTTLKGVHLYVCNEMQGETITFRLYDAGYNAIWNTFYQVPENAKLPGFVYIPVNCDMVVDQEYYYTIEGLSADLYVNLEDTMSSTSYSNGIMSYEGKEVPGVNVIIRYAYSSPLKTSQIWIYGIAIAAVAAALAFLAKMIFKKTGKDGEITIQKALQLVCNPLIVIVGIFVLLQVFPGRKFGTGFVNYGFYGFSIILLMGVLLWFVNGKRTPGNVTINKAFFADHFADAMQAICIAGMLWSCYEYMNGLYNIHHDLAGCKQIIWLALMCLTMLSKKQVLNIANAVWLVAGSVIAYFYAKPYLGVEEDGELYTLMAYAIVAVGFVAISVVGSTVSLIRKKEKLPKIQVSYFFPLATLVILLIAFRNMRKWPVYLGIILLVVLFRLIFWKKRERFIGNLCNGIILNFFMMVLFSLWHRPYHYYIYYRYYMGYHTVTVTATYLTLVMAAVLVKFFVKYKKVRCMKDMMGECMLLGVASSYMIFTLSRTGFLSVGVMVIAVLITTCLLERKQYSFVKELGKKIGIMILSVFLSFPITFSATRMVPAVIDDPVIFEVEPRVCSIVKGTPSDSTLYINIEQFIKVFCSKVLGVGEDVTGRTVAQNVLEVIETDVLLAGSQDTFTLNGDFTEEEVDFTNGRLDIFRSYMEHWNTTGHELMGVPLPDGTIAVHAHNVYLQVTHDHGTIVGLYFVIFIVFSLLYSLIRAWKNYENKTQLMLVPVLLLGFATAGIVEWIFHPCNPFGIIVMLALLSLLIPDKRSLEEGNGSKETL